MGLKGSALSTELQDRNGSTTWTRTRDTTVNSRMLYQLSYRGMCSLLGYTQIPCAANPIRFALKGLAGSAANGQ